MVSYSARTLRLRHTALGFGLASAVAGVLALFACVSDPPAGSSALADAGAEAAANLPDVRAPDDSAQPPMPKLDPFCPALVSYWPGEGSTADLLGNNTLSWQPPGAQRYTVGKFGAAFTFPMRNVSYLEKQGATGLSMTNVLTLAFWYSASTADEKVFFDLSTAGANHLKIATNYRAFTVAVGAQAAVEFPTTIITATYNHIAIVLRSAGSGSSVDFYVNGQRAGGAPKNLPMAVGKDAFPDQALLHIAQRLEANVDEFTLIRRALEDADIDKLYKTGLNCGAVTERPDAGPDLLRCPAPASEPTILCGSFATSCAAGQVCCESNLGGVSCQTRASCKLPPGTVALECAKKSDCPSGNLCCLANTAPINAQICTNIGAIPVKSTCKPACDAAQETQLCAANTDCASPTKCTGFTAKKPSAGGDYPLGACLP
jgi:Concanavalin A-like lectin/glucanases superfamily